LIKARFIEEIDELIAEYKEAGTSTDDINLDEELGQLLADVIEEVQERDWERSF
jgi:NTP pyrophosphatase (non-canonical NTP hydrolase)